MLAVPIGVGFGYWIDGLLGSEPTGIAIGAVIGFGALVLRLTRMRPPETVETGAAAGEPSEAGEAVEPGEHESRDDSQPWSGDLSRGWPVDESHEDDTVVDVNEDERTQKIDRDRND